MNLLTGIGEYLWVIWRVEGGKEGAPPDPERIADRAEEMGLSHVLIKVADGRWGYNIHQGVDLVPAVVAALQARGIQAWGWQYIYGIEPAREAATAVRRVQELNLDGFVVNAEKEFKAGAHMAGVAQKYMQDVRAGIPTTPTALSSYKWPNYHRELPWAVFAEYINFWMPQVYWIQASNPAQQLARSIEEHRAIKDLPIVATGAAYKEWGWAPTPDEVAEFLQACVGMGVPAANFWEWYYTFDPSKNPWGYDYRPVISEFRGLDARPPRNDEEPAGHDPQVDDIAAWQAFQRVAQEAGQDIPV